MFPVFDQLPLSTQELRIFNKNGFAFYELIPIWAHLVGPLSKESLITVGVLNEFQAINLAGDKLQRKTLKSGNMLRTFFTKSSW